jgi:hypothetical protein
MQYHCGMTDKVKPKNSEKSLFHCHFIHHKTHVEKCKLDLMGVYEGKWDRGGIEPSDDSTFLMEKKLLILTFSDVFLHKEIRSASRV